MTYTPLMARFDGGSSGFSTSETMRPSSTSANPVVLGLRDRLDPDATVCLAVRLVCVNEVSVAVLEQHVAEEYEHLFPVHRCSCLIHAVTETLRIHLLDKCELEAVAVLSGRVLDYLFLHRATDHDYHFVDVCLRETRENVTDDGASARRTIALGFVWVWG